MIKDKIDCLLVDRREFEVVLEVVTPGTALFSSLGYDYDTCCHVLGTLNLLGLISPEECFSRKRVCYDFFSGVRSDV